MNKIMTAEDRGPSVERLPNPRQRARKAFLRKAIPYAMSLFNRAEAMGLDWESVPMDQLSAYIILHEEFTRPCRMREHHEFA